jgi:hypothetical protein
MDRPASDATDTLPDSGPPRGRLAQYHHHTRGAWSGFLMGCPLALIYTLCILFGPVTSEPQDFFIRLLISLFGARTFTLIQVGLTLSFLVLVFTLHRRGRFRVAYFGPLVVESMVYAAVISACVWFGMQALGLKPVFPPSPSGRTALVSALGEAVNQETFFRWILLEVLFLLTHRAGKLKPLQAKIFSVFFGALIYASICMAAIDQGWCGLGALVGPALTTGLAGLVYGVLYFLRGYPVCAYTHVFVATFFSGVAPHIGL